MMQFEKNKIWLFWNAVFAQYKQSPGMQISVNMYLYIKSVRFLHPEQLHVAINYYCQSLWLFLYVNEPLWLVVGKLPVLTNFTYKFLTSKHVNPQYE